MRAHCPRERRHDDPSNEKQADEGNGHRGAERVPEAIAAMEDIGDQVGGGAPAAATKKLRPT